tara:strand:- start:43 stop:147 length:105 start_codon:yes stop_codon:yes gene_type:complete
MEEDLNIGLAVIQAIAVGAGLGGLLDFIAWSTDR